MAKYVNLQSGPVTVSDEKRRAIVILPWARHDSPNGGLFVVEGDHYAQFVSPSGPLYPFPSEQADAGRPAFLPSLDPLDQVAKKPGALLSGPALAAVRTEQETRVAPTPEPQRRKATAPVTEPVEVEESADDFTKIKGIGKEIAAGLNAIGLRSYQALAEADVETLVEVHGISQRLAGTIQTVAKKLAKAKK